MASESEELEEENEELVDEVVTHEREVAESDGAEDDSDAAEAGEEYEEDEEEEEEPKLKYARLTSNLGPVYRNGDATSTFLVAGDKMVIGTHNGNIHVISLPTFQSLRFYHAHTASVTSISISPFPPPLPTAKPEGVARVVSQAQNASAKSSVAGSRSPGGPRTPAAARPVPNSPSNAIYIATSSLDGNVCIASLVDLKDVQLRNFARPVQAVALSPDYKNDRTYLSGGLAGNFVLTIGGLSGASTTSSTTGSAAAVTQSWLGTIGLAANTGKDTILHSGEGTISTIKWSLSGKYVVWINEHGIKIMRTPIQLDSQDVDAAWKRIAHVDRPRDATWDEMATVWKARAEWIDDTQLESDEGDKARDEAVSSPALKNLKQQATKSSKKIEKLLVGWGGTIWIINVHPGGVGVGKHAGERTVGRAEIVKILRMDCIVSGLSLYTPTLLLVLAYVTPDKEDDEPPSPPTTKGHKSKPSTASTSSEPSGGIRRRQNALSPELRLIDLASSEEVDTDTLTVSRFERLSSNDYHLGVLPPTQHKPFAQTTKGTLETLSGMGSGMWDAAINAATVSATLLSSAASIRSNGSKSDGESSSKVSGISTITNNNQAVHQHLTGPGMKIFIHSPYDCILSTKRDLSDHVTWLLEQKQYEKAWKVIDEHPEVISSNPDRLAEIGPGTLEKGQSDIFYDDMASTTGSMGRLIDSAVEKEKRRIGELWIQQLVNAGDWTTAGQVCGKVLGTSPRWEHWVWTFAGANKFDEITPYIPTAHLQPPLPSTVYEVVLGHYIHDDRPRLRELLEQWAPELFDIRTVTTALENELKYRDVREDSVEDGEQGRDWRIVMESLGKLYAADGRPREALKCYIRLHDADAAMSLIKEYHLVDAVADDVPAFILLRVSEKQEQSAPLGELEEVTSEAIALLVDESRHGLLRPEVVVKQLQDKELILYLFFYLRSLWRGHFLNLESDQNRERLVSESRSLVDDFADLAVQLFGTYDRPLLMEFLRTSTFYSFEKACRVCESHDYIPELVYLYSKTGQTKRALYLIIDRLADVSQAIAFAKQQDDADLWDDLLSYSMDKPRFIRGLLEEVGTAIDPITLVRRIPEGLEIEGLREGLSRMIKEYEIQYSISSGVARVLRGEVAAAQATLRAGQRKGVKFSVVAKASDHVDVAAVDVPTTTDESQKEKAPPVPKRPTPGHCVGCHEPFSIHESETLIGFACGHVFHLSHLLSYLDPDAPSSPMDFDIGWDEDARVRSVGAKVTHARLLRDRIRGGCPVCKQAEGCVV